MMDVDELRRLEGAATHAPWINSDSTHDAVYGFHENVTAESWDVACCHPGDQDPDDDREGQARRNAEFIAAARNALPYLLNELERYRALVAEMQESISDGVDPQNFLIADLLARHGFEPV